MKTSRVPNAAKARRRGYPQFEEARRLVQELVDGLDRRGDPRDGAV